MQSSRLLTFTLAFLFSKGVLAQMIGYTINDAISIALILLCVLESVNLRSLVNVNAIIAFLLSFSLLIFKLIVADGASDVFISLTLCTLLGYLSFVVGVNARLFGSLVVGFVSVHSLCVALGIITAYDANEVGNYLTISLTYGVSLCFLFSWLHGPIKQSSKFKIILASVVVLQSSILILYPSRGSFITLVLIWLLRLSFSLKIRNLVPVILLVCCIAFGLLALADIASDIYGNYMIEKFVRLSELDLTKEPRYLLYKTVLDVIDGNELLGIGLGVYQEMFGIGPHNVFLDVWLSFGILGLIISFFMLLFVPVRMFIKDIFFDRICLNYGVYFSYFFVFIQYLKSFGLHSVQYLIIPLLVLLSFKSQNSTSNTR